MVHKLNNFTKVLALADNASESLSPVEFQRYLNRSYGVLALSASKSQIKTLEKILAEGKKDD